MIGCGPRPPEVAHRRARNALDAQSHPDGHEAWGWDGRTLGRTVIARGRDACDVPLTISFGKHTLEAFSAVTEEVSEDIGCRKSFQSARALEAEPVEIAF